MAFRPSRLRKTNPRVRAINPRPQHRRWNLPIPLALRSAELLTFPPKGTHHTYGQTPGHLRHRDRTVDGRLEGPGPGAEGSISSGAPGYRLPRRVRRLEAVQLELRPV